MAKIKLSNLNKIDQTRDYTADELVKIMGFSRNVFEYNFRKKLPTIEGERALRYSGAMFYAVAQNYMINKVTDQILTDAGLTPGKRGMSASRFKEKWGLDKKLVTDSYTPDLLLFRYNFVNEDTVADLYERL